VGSRLLMLSIPGEDQDVFYRLGHAFALVTGLQLTTLEVVVDFRSEDGGVPADMVMYDTIRNLFTRGTS
jgi:hypothetical protein